MTSHILTSWRWHLNYEVDWHPLFACRHLSLPSVLMFWQMVEVFFQHLNAGTQTPIWHYIWHGMCRWTALQRMLWMGSCHLLFCSALGCQWLQILPRTWVMSVFLPTSAPSPELVTESEVVTALRISLLEKRDALSGTKSWVPALSTGFSLPWFACSCCLLDISYPSYSVDNGSRCRDFPRYVIFEAALTTWQFLYAIFFTWQGATARCCLSTAVLSVTFPWHTASTL